MREMIVGNWRTTLLGVCLLVALLMYTQGKINSYEFLAVMGFFNVGGFLLARDARAKEPRAPADPPVPQGRRLSRFDRLASEVFYRLLLVFILVVLALCFYPLLRDALDGRTTPRTYQSGSTMGTYGAPYGSPYSPGYPATGQPAPATTPPAHDDEPPHPATGPGPGPTH